MAKTIKIIDLLNKIANGEEVPERIKTNNRIYHYCFRCDTYEDEKEKDIVIPIDKYCLNGIVEIIEEQQDIDKIKTLNPEEVYFKDGTELVYKLMYDKINEIAMRVNKISKNIKDKE